MDKNFPDYVPEYIEASLKKLAQQLSFTAPLTFKSPQLFITALVHKSFGNETRSHLKINDRDNERLEFLGDAVLGLIISRMLCEHYPDYPEGVLSKLRASLVNEKVLADVARGLSLGELLFLGKGEETTKGREKESILASTFEAVIAALYLDQGFDATEQCLRSLFSERVEQVQEASSFVDFKTKLQELTQAKLRTTPRYETLRSFGPDHDKTFEIQVFIADQPVLTTTGKSKKEGEQNAAREVLKRVEDGEASLLSLLPRAKSTKSPKS